MTSREIVRHTLEYARLPRVNGDVRLQEKDRS